MSRDVQTAADVLELIGTAEDADEVRHSAGEQAEAEAAIEEYGGGAVLIDHRMRFFLRHDGMWCDGVAEAFNAGSGRHRIRMADGTARSVRLCDERWLPVDTIGTVPARQVRGKKRTAGRGGNEPEAAAAVARRGKKAAAATEPEDEDDDEGDEADEDDEDEHDVEESEEESEEEESTGSKRMRCPVGGRAAAGRGSQILAYLPASKGRGHIERGNIDHGLLLDVAHRGDLLGLEVLRDKRVELANGRGDGGEVAAAHGA